MDGAVKGAGLAVDVGRVEGVADWDAFDLAF